MTETDCNGSPFDESVDPEWTAMLAILNAIASTKAALEHLCVRLAHADELDPATTRQLLKAAVDDHRRATEDLELALAAAARREDEHPE